MPQIPIHDHYIFRLGTEPITTTSHILCRVPAMPCRPRFRMCRSHMIYTVRPCLYHTYNSVPIPCPCRAPTMPLGKRLFGATAQHSSGTELHVLTSAVSRRHVGDVHRFGFFRLLRGHSRRLLTRTLLPFVMCSSVLMTMKTADYTELYIFVNEP